MTPEQDTLAQSAGYRVEPSEEAYQAYLDQNRRPQILRPGEEPSWVIRYADVDMPDELFAGENAEECARRRFDQQRAAWAISLYKEVARG